MIDKNKIGAINDRSKGKKRKVTDETGAPEREGVTPENNRDPRVDRER